MKKSHLMTAKGKVLLLACTMSLAFAGVCYADTSTPSDLPKEETVQEEQKEPEQKEAEKNKEEESAAKKDDAATQPVVKKLTAAKTLGAAGGLAATKPETQTAATQTAAATQPATTQQTAAQQPAAQQTAQPATAQKNGWQQDSNGWQFYENGDPVTDEWRAKDGIDRYLGADSYMVRSEKIYDGSDVYYVNENGEKAITLWYWFDDDHGWRFFGGNGAALKSGKWEIDDHYYIFDDQGMAMHGYVGYDDNNGYYDCNSNPDPVLEADYYCGDGSPSQYPNVEAFVGWHKYPKKLNDSRYAGFDEIWVCYNSQGKKLTGTKTIDGRQYELDNNGVLILGDVHINYYPSETNKNHHISEYYNSGASDALFISQGDTFEKEYPSDQYTFLYWIDDEGYTFKPNQKIPYDAGTYSLYGVWEDKNAQKKDSGTDNGKGGGNPGGSSRAEYTKDYKKARTSSVNTASEANLDVGRDASGPYVSGSWKQAADGSWSFTDVSGKDYRNTWAYVHNPFTTGQEKAGWFMFDENGKVRTGWYTDPTDGRTYYLNENVGSGDLGQMVTGWVQIGGMWYLFNDVSDGTRGCLLRGPLATPN